MGSVAGKIFSKGAMEGRYWRFYSYSHSYLRPTQGENSRK